MKILSEKIALKEKKINNENNNNEYSEIICQMIINKIISKAISQTNNDKIYSKLNDHCFEFIINSIDPFLSTNFIFYENSNMKNNNKSKRFFYSIIPENIMNTWIEIKEPNLPEFDRYHSNLIKIVKNFDNNNCVQKNNTNIEKKKESNNTESKNNIDNSLSRNTNLGDKILNTLKESVELDYHFNSNNNTNSEIKRDEEDKLDNLGIINKENEKKVNNIDEKVERVRKKTKSLIIDLPYYDLPKEVYENKYIALNSNEEYNLLRLEKEKEIMNKELEKNTEKNKKKDYFKNRLIREFDSNKITFDSNGCIINLNIPNVDSFSNDFHIPKPIINDSKLKNLTFYFDKENKNKNNISKKKNLMKYLSANIPTINKKHISNTENILNRKNDNFEKKSSQKINFISKFKIMSPSYSLINQKKKIKIEYNQIYEEEEKKKKLRIKLPPSGSNFDKIVPQVGVIIQNNTDNQTKKGGFEYYNKYNKPSINEFKQLVDETLQLNNNIKTSHLSNNNKKQNIKTEKSFDYNGYNQDFLENNNPLIQNPAASISNLKLNHIKNNNINKSLTKNKSHLDSNIYKSYSNYKVIFKSFDNKYNKFKNKNLFDKIILSQKNLAPNLYNILTKKNDEDNEDEIENKENGKKNKNLFKTLKKRSFSNLYNFSENIIKDNNFFSLIPFKRGKKSPKKILSLPNIIETKKANNINMEYGEEIIDNFNSKILINKNWGDFIFSERNIKLGYESKNIFRKRYKLNDNKEIIEKRHRVPHSMINKNNEKNQKF